MLESIRNFVYSKPPQLPHLGQIPAKFHPYIINHPAFEGPKELKEITVRLFDGTQKDQAMRPIDHVLFAFGLAEPRPRLSQQSVRADKPFITTSDALEGYIIKQQRTDQLQNAIAPDALLYRLRKAHKIGNVLRRDCNFEFAVPKKYLYYDHGRGQWFLIAERFQDIGKPHSFRLGQSHLSILAKLAFEANLEDIHWENIQFSRANKKWCIIDTEPLSRKWKKEIRAYPLSRFWLDNASLRMATALKSIQVMLTSGALFTIDTEAQRKFVAKPLDRVTVLHLRDYLKNSVTKAAAMVALAGLLPLISTGIVGTLALVALLFKASALALQVGVVLNTCREEARTWMLDLWSDRHPWLAKLTLQPARFVWRRNPRMMLAAAIALWIGVHFALPYPFIGTFLKYAIQVGLTTASTFLHFQEQSEMQARFLQQGAPQ